MCELISIVNLSSFLEGARRYLGLYTDLEGDVTTLDLIIRRHAHVEQRIERLKDSRLCRLPFPPSRPTGPGSSSS